MRALSGRRRRARILSAPVASSAALLAIVIAVVGSTRVEAQVVHLDIAIQEEASGQSAGRLSIHGYDFTEPLDEDKIILDRRAFVRGVTLSGNSLFSPDPGMISRIEADELDPWSLTAPVPDEQLSFNILSPPASTMSELAGRNVNFWDGTGGTPTWGPTNDTDEGLTVRLPTFPFSSATADGTATDVPGFVIASSSPSGSLHEHIRFILDPQNGELPAQGGPDFGIYVVLLEFTYPPYAEWVPVFVGVDNFTGFPTPIGRSVQLAAVDDLMQNFVFPLCSDGIDNDKDGLIDLADGGCVDGDDLSERGAANECDNGIDDDLDGFVDYPNDTDCSGPTGVSEVPEPGFLAGLSAGALMLGALHRRRSARLRRP